MPDADAVFSNAVGFISEKDIPAGEALKVTRIQNSERSTTVVAAIRKGHGLRPHAHLDHDEIIVFHEGEADFRFGDEMRVVRAGDVVSVPAGVVHGTVHAKTTCILTAVFAPPFAENDPDRHYADD